MITETMKNLDQVCDHASPKEKCFFFAGAVEVSDRLIEFLKFKRRQHSKYSSQKNKSSIALIKAQIEFLEEQRLIAEEHLDRAKKDTDGLFGIVVDRTPKPRD
ncbi:MAG: hypothetical protein JRG71_10460 [Deltaproteobacteria bacterium]|nr:hypothetical protein [Deltaproteobacteria bacterium]